jgi:hypothetical protein
MGDWLRGGQQEVGEKERTLRVEKDGSTLHIYV